MDEEKPKFVARKAIPAKPADPSTARREGYRFRRNPRTTVIVLSLTLWVVIAVSVAQLLVNLNLVSAARSQGSVRVDPYDFQSELRGRKLNEKLVTAQKVKLAVDVVALLIFGATGLLFLLWIFEASSNSWGFGAQGLRDTPLVAVLCCVIPVVNLIKPYQLVQQMWKVSLDPKGWQQQPPSGLVKLWWAVVLVGVLIAALQIHMQLSIYLAPGPAAIMAVAFLGALQVVGSSLPTMKLVQRLVMNQMALVG